MKRKAVFFDRDGTLNDERRYLADPDLLELLPGVIDGLKRLMAEDFLLFVVTNQSGIGRGYYTEEAMHWVNFRLLELLEPEGVRIEEIYYAPEAPEQPSRGRKPSPEFLYDARDAFDLDLGASYMIGDKLSDLACGWNAGVKRSILVRTGYGSELEKSKPDAITEAVIVAGITEAVDVIVGD
ncbi:MAG: D-glycero-alpha-D-manno-heptose-1,7-bisphosphate 7-phosphatase [Verrucomicrobiia bacterium]|jgi:D-glycero-D-manno-heptose 1,7-bisphosphate phosphatase